MGSGVAVNLVTEQSLPSEGLILQSAFTSFGALPLLPCLPLPVCR